MWTMHDGQPRDRFGTRRSLEISQGLFLALIARFTVYPHARNVSVVLIETIVAEVVGASPVVLLPRRIEGLYSGSWRTPPPVA
jgi:hypothetical protein